MVQKIWVTGCQLQGVKIFLKKDKKDKEKTKACILYVAYL